MGLFSRFKTTKKDAEKVDEKVEKSVNNTDDIALVAKKTDSVAKDKTAKSPKSKELSYGAQSAYRILMKPVVSEKASVLAALNKYVFEVYPTANKVEIKKAIKGVYNVDVVDVNIVRLEGKHVRYGRTSGKQKNRKKAIVTLKKGQSLNLYEGV